MIKKITIPLGTGVKNWKKPNLSRLTNKVGDYTYNICSKNSEGKMVQVGIEDRNPHFRAPIHVNEIDSFLFG